MSWDLNEISGLGWPTEAAVLLLLFMLACAVGIVISQSIRHDAARKRFRTFARQVAGALRVGNLDEALSIVQRNGNEYFREVAPFHLGDVQSHASRGFDAHVIETVKRGLEHSVNRIQGEMRRGLNGLATVTASAVFVGVLGTVMGIITSAFPGCVAPPSVCLAATASGISESVWVTGLGLFVALPTSWCYKYFNDKIEAFGTEMESTSLELLNGLIVGLKRRE